MSREADLLEAMRYANLDEQRQITAELDRIRSRRTAAVQADRATDLGVQVARDHLTPVFVHGQHTAATDWLDEVAPSYTQADIKKIDRQVRAEAASWFNHTSQVIREYPDEFAEQARGVASRTASQFGTLAPQVESLFLRHVSSLYRVAEGTDLAGVPSASDSTGNPNATEWANGPDVLAPADVGDFDAPPGLDSFPQQPSPEGGSGESAPSDQAATSAPSLPAEDTLDVTDSNNAAGSTQSEVAQVEGSYDYHDKPSVWSQSARSFLGTEEGQTPPVPGEADEEQSGEAGTTLPRSVEVPDAPETMDNFIDFNKEDAAAVDSNRAKNITGRRVTADDQPPWLKKDGDDDADDNGGKSDDDADDESDKDKAEDKEFPELKMDKTDDDESNESGNHDTDGDAKTGRRRTAVATGPNPQGSYVYNPQDAIDQGYKEGYRYAVLWTPGKPVPAALTSSAAVGHQYNAEYVQGYKEGTAAAVGQMDATTKAAWAKAATAVQMVARRRQAALPQLELADMDQTPANPGEFGATAPTVDGKGASDVASVPTPGAATADYPAPSGASQTPAIGDDGNLAEEWDGQEAGAADSTKAAAFRATVQANLRRGR